MWMVDGGRWTVDGGRWALCGRTRVEDAICKQMPSRSVMYHCNHYNFQLRRTQLCIKHRCDQTWAMGAALIRTNKFGHPLVRGDGVCEYHTRAYNRSDGD